MMTIKNKFPKYYNLERKDGKISILKFESESDTGKWIRNDGTEENCHIVFDTIHKFSQLGFLKEIRKTDAKKMLGK